MTGSRCTSTVRSPAPGRAGRTFPLLRGQPDSARRLPDLPGARRRGHRRPATLGKGFLIDDLSLDERPDRGLHHGRASGPCTRSSRSIDPRDGRDGDARIGRGFGRRSTRTGPSNWPKKRGVIPVQFELDAKTETTTTTTTTAGPVAFESIVSDATDANDYSFLKFVPDAPLAFTDLTELTADYAFLDGRLPRWLLAGSGAGHERRRHEPTAPSRSTTGTRPQFGNGGTGGCTPASMMGSTSPVHNLIGLSDVRYDTTQLVWYVLRHLRRRALARW